MAKGYGRPPMGRKGGKGMGMGMPGLNMDMIKQAQKMQADMERTQAELQEKEYTATAGGGVVSATVDGKHTLKALTIDPEAVDPEDVEMLQDMVIAAVNEAVRRYTGRKKDGIEYSFISSVKLNYQQYAGRAAGVHDYQNAQVMLPKIPERNMSEVLKLVKDIRQLKEKLEKQ